MNPFSRTVCRLFRPAYNPETHLEAAPRMNPPSLPVDDAACGTAPVCRVPPSPRILGIACTDPEGHLFHTDERGRPALIAQAPGVPDLIGELDFQCLKRFLAANLDDRSLVILGRTTWHQMRSLLRLHCDRHPSLGILVADRSGIYRPEGQELRTQHTFQMADTLRELRLFALREAYAHGQDIVVLGGRSVYTSFAEYYDEFQACLVFPTAGDYAGGGAISIPQLLVNQPERSNRYHPSSYQMTLPIQEPNLYEVRHFIRA